MRGATVWKARHNAAIQMETDRGSRLTHALPRVPSARAKREIASDHAQVRPSTARRFFTSSGIARPSIFFFTKLDCMMSFIERYT